MNIASQWLVEGAMDVTSGKAASLYQAHFPPTTIATQNHKRGIEAKIRLDTEHINSRADTGMHLRSSNMCLPKKMKADGGVYCAPP